MHDSKLEWLKENEEKSNDKLEYILNSPIGTIVAFDTLKDGVKSGAIIERYQNNNRWFIEVETEYGARYTLMIGDILWVKTGSRWPKWVYEKFKESN